MKISTILKGGPGSGHHGHSGLAGVHGGSRSSKGTGSNNFQAGRATVIPGADGRTDVPVWSISNTYKELVAVPIVKSMTVDAGFAPVGNDRIIDHPKQVRVDMKKKIVEDLTELNPELSEFEVSGNIGAWAQNSNGRESSRLQKAVAEEFDVPLSEWQTTTFDRHNATRNSVPFDTDKKFVRSMYEHTQNHLADLGYSPDDTVTLFRGIGGMGIAGKVGTEFIYEGNAMESWTVAPRVATSFAYGTGKGSMISMEVPVRNILSTATTGFGCLNELECVIFGSIPNQRATLVHGTDYRNPPRLENEDWAELLGLELD